MGQPVQRRFEQWPDLVRIKRFKLAQRAAFAEPCGGKMARLAIAPLGPESVRVESVERAGDIDQAQRRTRGGTGGEGAAQSSGGEQEAADHRKKLAASFMLCSHVHDDDLILAPFREPEMKARPTSLQWIGLGIMVAANAWTAAQAQEPPAAAAFDISRIMKVDPETGRLSLDPACPETGGEEIVICGQPTGPSPYRLPPTRPGHPGEENRAWSARAHDLAEASRTIDSNSTVGSAGQTGWRAQLLREWAEARREIARQREREERPER
jgi:hypothetical protein